MNKFIIIHGFPDEPFIIYQVIEEMQSFSLKLRLNTKTVSSKNVVKKLKDIGAKKGDKIMYEPFNEKLIKELSESGFYLVNIDFSFEMIYKLVLEKLTNGRKETIFL